MFLGNFKPINENSEEIKVLVNVQENLVFVLLSLLGPQKNYSNLFAVVQTAEKIKVIKKAR